MFLQLEQEQHQQGSNLYLFCSTLRNIIFYIFVNRGTNEKLVYLKEHAIYCVYPSKIDEEVGERQRFLRFGAFSQLASDIGKSVSCS